MKSEKSVFVPQGHSNAYVPRQMKALIRERQFPYSDDFCYSAANQTSGDCKILSMDPLYDFGSKGKLIPKLL